MLGKCDCCEVYKKEIEYLRGLLDRTLNLIAPKEEEKPDPRLKADEPEKMVLGDG